MNKSRNKLAYKYKNLVMNKQAQLSIEYRTTTYKKI